MSASLNDVKDMLSVTTLYKSSVFQNSDDLLKLGIHGIRSLTGRWRGEEKINRRKLTEVKRIDKALTDLGMYRAYEVLKLPDKRIHEVNDAIEQESAKLSRIKGDIEFRIAYLQNLEVLAERLPIPPGMRPPHWFREGNSVVVTLQGHGAVRNKVTGIHAGPGVYFQPLDRSAPHGRMTSYSPRIMHVREWQYLSEHPSFRDFWLRLIPEKDVEIISESLDLKDPE